MAKRLPAKLASAMDQATRKDIVPRLRTKAWLTAIAKQMPAEQLPLVETWQGDVLVTYALDLPEQFALVNARIQPGRRRNLLSDLNTGPRFAPC